MMIVDTMTWLLQSSVSIHGATTNYTDTFNPTVVTAATGTHWSKSVRDGLGHKVPTQAGVVVSRTDTVYGPCACSPPGKAMQISQPYGVSGSTITTSDGAGMRRARLCGIRMTATGSGWRRVRIWGPRRLCITRTASGMLTYKGTIEFDRLIWPTLAV